VPRQSPIIDHPATSLACWESIATRPFAFFSKAGSVFLKKCSRSLRRYFLSVEKILRLSHVVMVRHETIQVSPTRRRVPALAARPST
jgi:hypothetical protein